MKKVTYIVKWKMSDGTWDSAKQPSFREAISCLRCIASPEKVLVIKTRYGA